MIKKFNLDRKEIFNLLSEANNNKLLQYLLKDAFLFYLTHWNMSKNLQIFLTNYKSCFVNIDWFLLMFDTISKKSDIKMNRSRNRLRKKLLSVYQHYLLIRKPGVNQNVTGVLFETCNND